MTDAQGDGGAGRRRAVVGVMGSADELHTERARALGVALANDGVHLLTGGGAGAMAEVSRAFATTPGREGLVIGVLRSAGADRPGVAHPGHPNPWVEVAIRTHLPDSGEQGRGPASRNHINVLSSDVVVALPGAAGTLSEVELALLYGRPVVAFVGAPGELPGLPQAVPMESELDGVMAFVREALEKRE